MRNSLEDVPQEDGIRLREASSGIRSKHPARPSTQSFPAVNGDVCRAADQPAAIEAIASCSVR